MNKLLPILFLLFFTVAVSGQTLKDCSQLTAKEMSMSEEEFQNIEKFKERLVPLAEKGNGKAQHFLASHMFKDSPSEAIRWARRSYENGCIDGALMLGFIYNEKKITPRDPEKAFKWFSIAAEAGDANAASMLSHMYHTGDGVEKDEEKSLYWLYVSRGEQ